MSASVPARSDPAGEGTSAESPPDVGVISEETGRESTPGSPPAKKSKPELRKKFRQFGFGDGKSEKNSACPVEKE